MSKKNVIIAVLPAYEAQNSLVQFLTTLPKNIFDEIILIDDASKDNTYLIAKKQKELTVYKNSKNLGYGGNMKKCLNTALSHGADIVVEIHPDGEYKSNAIIPALNLSKKGVDLVLGDRFTSYRSALSSGMFFYKYPISKFLTWVGNMILNTKIKDMHQGFRVYSRNLLENVKFNENSSDFIFTLQIICQAAQKKMKISNVKVKAIYRGKKRGVTFGKGFKYSVESLLVFGQYLLSRIGIKTGFLS